MQYSMENLPSDSLLRRKLIKLSILTIVTHTFSLWMVGRISINRSERINKISKIFWPRSASLQWASVFCCQSLEGQCQDMGDWARVRANSPCTEIKIYQRYCKSSLIATICRWDINFTALEPRRDIFLLIARVIFAKDNRSARDFAHAQCLETVPSTEKKGFLPVMFFSRILLSKRLSTRWSYFSRETTCCVASEIKIITYDF